MMGDVLDNLGEQDARVREVSAMVKDDQLTEADFQKIRRAAAKYIRSCGYAQGQVAQKLGSNETYVSNFLSGRFDQIPAATLQKFARNLNEWLELDHNRRRRQGERVFVHHKVAQKLIKAARIGRATNDIVVADGPTGIGKTATLLQLRGLIPASIYLYITPDCARKSGFLRALYEAVWEHRGPARPTLADVIERLKHSDRLLMLDNADVLEPATYPTIMALHDVCNIPILIVGTYKLRQKLMADGDHLRGQMASRIGLRIELLSEQTSARRGGRAAEWISAVEIRQLYEGGRVKLHPSAVARLKAIANFDIGRLRRCGKLMRYATSRLRTCYRQSHRRSRWTRRHENPANRSRSISSHRTSNTTARKSTLGTPELDRASGAWPR